MASILIVDSSPVFLEGLQKVLAGKYHVYTASDGKAALELAQAVRPDIMILDLILPGMDGITLLETLHGQGIRPKVLALTRVTNWEIEEKLASLGASHLILKPCRVRTVEEWVESLAVEDT